MTITLERNGRIVEVAPAELITADREVAWAEGLIRHNPLYAWILGRFVSAGAANANGHIFDADELRTSAATLANAPLNMLHRPHQVLGTYVGAELVYPAAAAAAQDLGAPFVESLAAMWRYYFPEEYAILKMAHQAGLLAQSMECIPKTVTCATGCAQTFPYAGRASDTYCDHINGPPAGARKLNKPLFSAGAIVIPPAVPAWKGAKVTRMSATLRTAEAEGLAARLYDQVAATIPGLNETQREQFMAAVMDLTGPPAATPVKAAPLSFPGIRLNPAPDARKGASEAQLRVNTRNAASAADADEPHAHVDRDPDEADSPCKICGKDAGSPIHQGLGPPRDAGAASDVSDTSAMIALYPPGDVAAVMALSGDFSDRLPPSDLHITLAYLGPEATLELDREAVEAAIAPLAAVSAPLEGWVSGIGRFSAGYPAGQDAWPLYASIDLPTLPEFRQKVVANLAAAGIPHARNHGFSPHMTLAYVQEGDEPAAAALLASGLAPVGLRIGSVVLAWGKDRTVFPLDGVSAGAQDTEQEAADALLAITARWRREAATIAVWDPLIGRSFSAEQRDAMARKGHALPDGSFPIANASDLRNAIQALGRAKNSAAAKRHIIKRAKALGATNLLPDGWA